jgi:hypothetical protein
MDLERVERAWAAGFFDGEGWAGGSGRGVVAQINQADARSIPDVLRRFQGAVGCGRISGPLVAVGRVDLYRWVASSRSDVAHVLERIAPWVGAVKRTEFEIALGVPGARSEWEAAPTPEKLAWAAGLFDGEGWTGLFEYRSRRGYFSNEMALTQVGSDEAPEVLDRFLRVIRLGRIYGPYRSPGHLPVYRWRTFGRVNVREAFDTIREYLGATKRSQGDVALQTVSAQPGLLRGNPAWGAYKTHCLNGHEYAAARIRPYRPRRPEGVQRRASKQCLVCSREQARARRAAKKSVAPATPSSRSTGD